MNPATLHQGVLTQDDSDGFAQSFGPIDDDQQFALGAEPARDQIFEQSADHGRIFRRSMPQAQQMLFALFIKANGRDDAMASEEFAVDQQGDRVRRHRPLTQLFEFLSRGGFPMTADAGALDAIALEGLLQSSFVVARRTVPGQQTRHRFLHLRLGLKGFVALQWHFFVITDTAQARPLQGHLPALEHYKSGLMTMAMDPPST